MTRVFVGTITNGIPSGVEFDEGSMTKEKWKIIEHSMDVYVQACEKIKLIEDLELAEEERELYQMNQKSMESLK